MLDPKNRREKGMQKWFCQLAWIHWIHAGLVFQLMGTGAFLYLPQLRTAFVEWHMGIRTWHLAAALLYAIVLAVSSPRIVAYAKRIPRRIAKRIHLMLVYAAGLIWLVSGAIMWRIHDFPAAWRGPAISLHDGLTWAAIPWISLHVAWFLLRRRYGSVIRRIGVVLRRHQTTPADLWRLSRDKTDISRRQAIIGLATVFLALSGAIQVKRLDGREGVRYQLRLETFPYGELYGYSLVSAIRGDLTVETDRTAELTRLAAVIQFTGMDAMKAEQIEYQVTFDEINRTEVETMPIVTVWTELP